MDGSHPPHLLGLLTDTPLWYRVLGFLWSVQARSACAWLFKLEIEL